VKCRPKLIVRGLIVKEGSEMEEARR